MNKHIWESTVRSLLVDLPITQTEVAARLRVSQATVSRWAAGKAGCPSLQETKTIMRMCQDKVLRIESKLKTLRLLVNKPTA